MKKTPERDMNQPEPDEFRFDSEAVGFEDFDAYPGPGKTLQ